MKQVILKSLTLCNFKGEKERTTNFNADVTTISGGNGLGKSRHFDAFIWLLFGKDTLDRKDYEVKSRVNGEELHNTECSVSGVIEVDGQEIALKRAYIEDWVKPRGQVERVFKGNHTECWWNETPVNVGEYTKRIESIIDSSLFKMITNPAFFANMNWKLQREQLFNLAGTISDADIVAKKPEFATLLDKISGKTLSDYKREIAAKKKRLSDELKEIDPRIDQTQKMKPVAEDFGSIESEIADVDKKISDIDKDLSDITAAMRHKSDLKLARQNEIEKLNSECMKLVFHHKNEAQNKAMEANSHRNELMNQITGKTREIDYTSREINAEQAEIAKAQREIDGLKARQNELRQLWFTENSKQYNGETVCPHCGQQLPAEMIERARELFTKAKSDKLAGITANGKEIGEQVEKLNVHIAEVQQNMDKANKNLELLNSELEELNARLVAVPAVKAAEVVPENIPEWVEMQNKIKSISAELATETSGIDTYDILAAKAKLQQVRNELSERLANRDAIARCDKAIADLNARARVLAQELAKLERDEYTIEQFVKTKIDECESRINAMFQFVSFRLFDHTIDGNLIETCVPTINGVPYGTANKASQVNAGLDIINTLCRYYGVCAPVFIDNAESVNEYTKVDSQIVYLKVTNNNYLTIE